MASANNTINTRIKLKSDIEDNWKKLKPTEYSEGFTPFNGEIIIYSPDTNHRYSRMKIGNGIDNVNDLPFVDAGTLNGEEEFISKYSNSNLFPQPGSSNKLYIDTSTNTIYHYTGANGYTILSDISLSTKTTEVANIIDWDEGRMTLASVDKNALKIINGTVPNLLYYNTLAVSEITKGVSE